jgi:hypothetical protein
MTAAWHLEQTEVHCRVEWRDNHLYWQISHPDAPGGQTRLALVSDLTVNHQPVQWTRLLGAAETQDSCGAPHLAVTVEDSSGRLRLVRHFELFAGHAFARTWGIVERTDADGEAPLIDGASILHLAVDAGQRHHAAARRAV